MSGNSGAWGLAMWKDGKDEVIAPAQEQGISLSGGDAIDSFLPTVPVGFLTLPPDGLGVPPVRNSDVVFAQRDGVVQFADYYEPRILTFQVDVPNEGCPACPSARQMVSRLTQEWSRNCSGATLIIFSDCHDPDATSEEKVYLGPYAVHGRPRGAEVTWRRSDVGGASVLLRFDAADARLILPDDLTPGTFWDLDQVQTIDADEQNLADDPDLSGATMTLNGATVDDSFFLEGGPSGPDGGPFFRRHIIAPNTTSPMAMALTGTGTSGQPVDPGDVFSVAWWARKTPGGPAPRLDWTWYTAAGAVISNHNGAAPSVGTAWQRVMQENIVAPALAEFVQWRLVWTGTAVADQDLDFAQVWINEGATVTAPETVEVIGTLCAYPTITLFPGLTAPVVVTYGNHQFTYTEDVISPIDIDTQYGRAADGFDDVTANLEGDFSSPLEPGVHDVTVQTGDVTDTGFVNFVWQNAVVSG